MYTIQGDGEYVYQLCYTVKGMGNMCISFDNVRGWVICVSALLQCKGMGNMCISFATL